MNFRKISRTAFMLAFFLSLFAIRPGFGKLELERCSTKTKIDGEMTRLTEKKIRIFKKENYVFELHCAHAKTKGADLYAEDSRGFISTIFIE
jgi:hypothetical protein